MFIEFITRPVTAYLIELTVEHGLIWFPEPSGRKFPGLAQKDALFLLARINIILIFRISTQFRSLPCLTAGIPPEGGLRGHPFISCGTARESGVSFSDIEKRNPI